MKLAELNKLLNSELTTKIKKSSMDNDELLINVKTDDLNSTLLFLKNNENCRFRQLIDITAVDFPNSE